MLQAVISCCKVLQNIKCCLETEIESTSQSIVVLKNLLRNLRLQMEIVVSGTVCTEEHYNFISGDTGYVMRPKIPEADISIKGYIAIVYFHL